MKVKLLKPHEHAGVPHPAGASIDVSKEVAEWLAAHGVIALPKPKRETKES